MDDSKHINSYFHKILEILKIKNEEFKISNIEIMLKMSIRIDGQLMKSLRNNPKIEITNDKIRFITSFIINSGEDLIEPLKDKNGKEGIEVPKLEDSPINIKPFIEQI